jgi:hypothetical protein
LTKYELSECKNAYFEGAPEGTCRVFIEAGSGRLFEKSDTPHEALEHEDTTIAIENYKDWIAMDGVNVVWILKRN